MKNSCTGDYCNGPVVEFGRHAWLRAMWRNLCGFKSRPGQSEEPRTGLWIYLLWAGCRPYTVHDSF